MPRFAVALLRELAKALFVSVGVPAAEAALVADHLIEAGLLGHDTHSLLRLPQYVELVRRGAVQPGARLKVLEQTRFTAQVSGGWNFGPVVATAAVQLAIDKARQGALSVVTVRDCNHVARLGRFAALACKERMIALLAANGHGGDRAVAPFGGTGQRLPTNPLSVAIPTGGPWPVLLDMTTSAISGGDLRLLRNLGKPAPAETLVDADGQPTCQVEAYYRSPPGAIVPLGFPQTGHKGFGLGMVVDLLAGALSGTGCTQAAAPRSGNALFIAALRVEAFIDWEIFSAEVQGLIERLKACPPTPGFTEVMLPGEHGYQQSRRRRDEGLTVDEQAWRQIRTLAIEWGVALPEPLAC